MDAVAEPATSRWLPVAAYAAVSAANQMAWLTYTPVTGGSARHYGVSEGAIGWLAELFPLVYVVLALPAGRLIDRAMPRWLAVGGLLTALGALVRLADTYPAVLVGQVLVAIAQPLVLNAVTAVSRTYLRADDRASGIAVSSAGIFGGMVLALLTGSAFGGRHLVALVVLQAALTVAGAGWLCVALGARRSSASAFAEATVPVRTVWADPVIRPLIGLVCGGFAVFVALTTWLQALLEPAHVSDTTSGYLLLAMVVAGVLGSAVLPAVIARRGAALRFVGASVVAGTAMLVLLAIAPGAGTAGVACVVLGTFLLTDLPVVLELVDVRAGEAAGTASALVWLAGNAAGLVVALVIQVVRHHPAGAFTVLAAVLVAVSPLLLLVSRRGASSARASSS